MSHNYTPPYPNSELTFAGAIASDQNRPGREYDERHFLIHDGEGYWLRNESGQPESSIAGRNAGGIWTGHECRDWNIGTHGVMELLPLPVAPASESTIAINYFNEVPSDRSFLVSNVPRSNYWGPPDDDDVADRNLAHVWTRESIIENGLQENIIGCLIEILPIQVTVQVEELLAETEPKEISLPPGQVLFSLLKGGEVRVATGNPNYKNKDAILKYMAAHFKSQSEYWQKEINGGRLPDSMSVAFMALMIQGDSIVITGEEYLRLNTLANTCRQRLVVLCDKPKQPSQAKIANAVAKTLEGY